MVERLRNGLHKLLDDGCRLFIYLFLFVVSIEMRSKILSCGKSELIGYLDITVLV